MRSIITCTILLLWACPCSASDPVQTLTYCDNLSGWSNNVQLSRDAQEGRFAIAASPPAGQTGFFTYNFFSTGQDISQRHSLSFWWKVEGNGLRDLKIKVRNHPLGGGREAIYTIWAGQTPPQGWQLAVLELAKPHDIWGSEPDYNQRYITYRTESDQNSNARLFIDHIATVDQTFSWQVDAPVYEKIPIDHLDFDGNGAVGFSDFILFVQKFGATQTDAGYDPIYDLDSDGQIGFGDFLAFADGFGSDGTQWYIPITFENHTAQPLNIVVGTETQILLTQTIEAGTTRIRVSIPRDILASRDPSIYPIPIWAQVADFIQTRSSS
ncbi:MAG: EF-hand domain-containing protein, partial [Gemmatimonadota bacterium]|nr:EF-hand domain-containing protein [Gemmatimonadota bacterium]